MTSIVGRTWALWIPNARKQGRRLFHQSHQSRASVLFALGALSNSRETQHFNKLSRLHRIEHSPPLKLIKTSEVDPFPLPEPSNVAQIPNPCRTNAQSASTRALDSKALAIGRVVITENLRHVNRLSKALQYSKERAARQNEMMRKAKLAWMREKQEMQKDIRVAAFCILLSIGTATMVATWKFWPPKNALLDSGITRTVVRDYTKSTLPLQAAASETSPSNLVSSDPLGSLPSSQLAPVEANATLSPIQPLSRTSTGYGHQSWWKGLFWKQ